MQYHAPHTPPSHSDTPSPHESASPPVLKTACGVGNVDDTMLRVTNAIRDAVRPDVTMFVECRNDVMDEKAIVCVIVQRGTARPYYLQGKGIRPEGVYVRQGASTVPATDTAILNMIKDTSGDSYEAARSVYHHHSLQMQQSYFLYPQHILA